MPDKKTLLSLLDESDESFSPIKSRLLAIERAQTEEMFSSRREFSKFLNGVAEIIPSVDRVVLTRDSSPEGDGAGLSFISVSHELEFLDKKGVSIDLSEFVDDETIDIYNRVTIYLEDNAFTLFPPDICYGVLEFSRSEDFSLDESVQIDAEEAEDDSIAPR